MTPQSALRLPAPLKEEPRKKSPLIEERPDRAEELSCPFEKGYLETQQRANSVRPYGGAYVPLEKAPVGCALCWDVPKGQGDNPYVCSLRSIHLPFQGRHIYRPRWDAIRFSISGTLESMWVSTSTGELQRAKKMPEKRKKSLSGTALSRQALFVIWCCDPVSRWFIFFGYPGTGRLRTCL